MTGKKFVDYIRYKTRTNSTTFPDADIVLLANVAKDELAKDLMDADEDTLVLPFTTSLIDSLREYPQPKTILSRIKKVEAKLDGTNWIGLKEMDLVDYPLPTDETTILDKFSNDEGRAKYDLTRKSIWIYSGAITAVSGGLKLWCNVWPFELTTDRLSDDVIDLSTDPTSTTLGFPREFHELWTRRVIIDYKESREKPIPLTQKETNYFIDTEKAKIAIKHGNLDREIFASIPPANERWQNGQDL